MRGVHDQSCEAAPVRLTRLDTAFLCLDRDASPMHLGALVTFQPGLAGSPRGVGRRIDPSGVYPGQPTGRAGSVLGDRWSGYLCELPVGELDPVKRLLLIRRAMHRNEAASGSPGAIPELIPNTAHPVHARWHCAGGGLPDRATGAKPGPRDWAVVVLGARLRRVTRRSRHAARRATPRRRDRASGVRAGRSLRVNGPRRPRRFG